MPKLTFDQYITCFKKQFLLQKGRGGRRISSYYTNYNQEQHLKNDVWGIMVFIHCGAKYGFSSKQMRMELKISPSLYEELKEETPNIINPKYADRNLHTKVITKIGLVQNAVLNAYFVKVT